VTSRIAKPVPPEVMIKFKPSLSAQFLTWSWICGISSGTILREDMDQISGSWSKMSLSIGPDRSVEASREAVSLTNES
jgi:hypothetical protein